jgi:PAS domain S-box-containing protein
VHDPAPTGPVADFSTLFEFLPIGAYRSTLSGGQIRANPALARINGFESEAEQLAAARDFGSQWYVQPGRRQAFRELLLRDGLVRDFVSEAYRHKTRERIWVSENAHLVRGADGTALYYEGTVEDITARVTAQAALAHREQQFRLIASQMPGMAYRFHVSPDGRRRYSFVSEGSRELYGVAPEALVADPQWLRRFWHPDDHARLERIAETTARGDGALHIEFRIVLDDGTLKWVQLTSNALPDEDGGTVRTGVQIDITARKQAEAMQRARERAELADRAKSQMLSRVSHELRTPLNAVLGFSQLMALDPRTDPRHQGWLRQIQASGEHLLGLVEDVLDLSSIEGGQLSLACQPTALAPVIDESWTMVSTGQAGPRVEFINLAPPQDPLPVLADRKRLKQVVANLLSNAVKYNRAGGQVVVEAWRDGTEVAFSVRDTGGGLDPEQLARLFKPFERVGAERGGIEGRGIGLALTRQLVEAMGGSIAVQSNPGQGSTFTVRLPAAP